MGSSITVVLDDATLVALDALAETASEPRDSVIARAISDLAELNAWQTAHIRRGLAAAEQGDFASDDDVARVRAKFRPDP
jgi:predicted transcriptional regulator